MQIGPRLRFDRHTAGNLLKNLSPALAFTPAGALGAGVAAALGERLRGKTDLGSIANAGLSNAAIGGGLHAGYGAIRGALGSGAEAGADAAAEPLDGRALSLASREPGWTYPTADVPRSTSAVSRLSSTFGDSLGSTARGVGSFVKDNPLAVSTGLQAIGGIADNAEARRNNTFAMNRLTRQDEIEEEDRKRRQHSGDEIRRLLGQFYPGSGY